MRRMPIRHRIAPFPRGRCLPRDYAVLVGISPGYPPVAGRLHTCYSPVRRSPPEVSKLTPALPLDLHVLSLSLAFILSQDQTLRCCILSFLFFLFEKRLQTCFRERFAFFSRSQVTPDLSFTCLLEISYLTRTMFSGLHLSLSLTVVNVSFSQSFQRSVVNPDVYEAIGFAKLRIIFRIFQIFSQKNFI